MKCPKCGGPMTATTGFSRPSSLCRDDGHCDSFAAFDDYSCVMCGKWLPPQPVKDHVVIDLHTAELPPKYQFVELFYETLAQHRQRNTSWGTLARLMNHAGFPCNDNSLKKYYLLEQHKRANIEKKEWSRKNRATQISASM